MGAQAIFFARWLADIRVVFSVCVMFSLAACASHDRSLVLQGLEQTSGATVTRLRSPMILYKDELLRAAHAHDFVAIGPLEINCLGARRYRLWLSVWSTIDRQGTGEESADWSSVLLLLDGEPMEIGGGRNHALEDVAEYGYVAPEAWAVQWYYPVTRDQLLRLVSATEIQLTTPVLDQLGRFYMPWQDQAERLRPFANYMGQ